MFIGISCPFLSNFRQFYLSFIYFLFIFLPNLFLPLFSFFLHHKCLLFLSTFWFLFKPSGFFWHIVIFFVFHHLSSILMFSLFLLLRFLIFIKHISSSCTYIHSLSLRLSSLPFSSPTLLTHTSISWLNFVSLISFLCPSLLLWVPSPTSVSPSLLHTPPP